LGTSFHDSDVPTICHIGGITFWARALDSKTYKEDHESQCFEAIHMLISQNLLTQFDSMVIAQKYEDCCSQE